MDKVLVTNAGADFVNLHVPACRHVRPSPPSACHMSCMASDIVPEVIDRNRLLLSHSQQVRAHRSPSPPLRSSLVIMTSQAHHNRSSAAGV